MSDTRIYLSSIDEKTKELARQYPIGIEIAEYCTADNFDHKKEAVEEKVQNYFALNTEYILHGPFNELYPCAIDPLARDLAKYRYMQTLEYAKSRGIKKVIFHGGYHPGVYYPCWYTQQSVVFWKQFLENLSFDGSICLENVWEEEPELLKEIVDQVGDERLSVCLDVGHVNVYSKTDVFQWIHTLGNRIGHFHLHNNDGTVDAHQGVHQGNLSLKEIIAEGKKYAPGATMTFEIIEAKESVEWFFATFCGKELK